jgi:hypothetical protein
MSPRRAAPEKQKQATPPWLIFLAIVVVAGFAVFLVSQLVGAVMSANNPAQSTASLPTSSGLTSNGRTEGDPKAQVTFVEFSDFQ